jgi:hypothetical protein
MDKKKKIVFISSSILLISLLGFLVIYYYIGNSRLTYNQYRSRSDNIINNLVNNYDGAKEGKVVFTIYPGEKEINKYWVKEEWNAVNDNLNSNYNKERVVYIEHNQIVTKVTLTYCKELKNKNYLSSTRVNGSALKNKELTNLPIIVSNSITIKGIYINIMTFNKITNIDYSEKNKVELYNTNTDITQTIQTYIIDNSI